MKIHNKKKTDYPDAAEVVRDAFETAFLKNKKSNCRTQRTVRHYLREKFFSDRIDRKTGNRD